MDQLVDYVEKLNKKIHKGTDGSLNPMWKEIEDDATDMMKKLVIYQCCTVCEKYANWNVHQAAFMDLQEDRWIWNNGSWYDPQTGNRHYSGQNQPPNPDSYVYWDKLTVAGNMQSLVRLCTLNSNQI
mmetsp:Transcript_21275/g.49066  ORF Transcript_21275/g.49066 Transcript_21275/m.49066 type:complete len:127 (-) Transcript_21275:594-974(-)